MAFGGFGTGAFGSTNTGTGAFGSGGGGGFGIGASSNTTNSNPFGPATGFSTNTNTTNSFGAPSTGYGAAPSTGMFGTNTATTGFGAPSNTNTTGGFGAATGGGLFGGNNAMKTNFGTSTTTPFGGTSGNTGFGGTGVGTGFGQSSTTGTGFGTGFGSNTTSTGFGLSTQNTNQQNINNLPPFQPVALTEGSSKVYPMTELFGQDPGKLSYNNVENRLRWMAGNQQQQPQASGFGVTNTQQPATGFGAPATTNAFGATNTNTTTTGFGSGGAFGTGNTTGTGLFGAPANTNTNTGGIFGAPKPAIGGFGTTTGTGLGGAFGSTQNAAPQTTQSGFGASAFGTTNTGFGTNTANTTGTNNVFGQPSGSGLFGTGTTNTGFGTGTNTTTGSGLFGLNNQTQNTQSGLGGLSGTGFGTNTANNQLKPSGTLFGSAAPAASTATSQPSLFGGATTTATATPSLFGTAGAATTTTNPSGGLFGTAAAPAAQTNNLFGPSNTTTAPKPFGTTGGIFGTGIGTSNAAQPSTGTTGGGLFGTNTAGQTGGGLFGGATARPGGLFGTGTAGATGTTGTAFGLNQSTTAPGTQNSGLSLLGNQAAPPAPAPSNFLGASTQSGVPPTGLTASLLDNPYGNPQLFSSLNTPDSSRIGPLATPLPKPSAARKLVPLPSLNNRAARLLTPQNKSTLGFSVSHSPFAPGASMGSSPLMRSTGGGGTWGGSSSLRASAGHNLMGDSGIFAPGALAPSSSRARSSLRRLTIQVDPRRNPFTTPDVQALSSPLNKKVQWGLMPDDSQSNSLSIPNAEESPAPAESDESFEEEHTNSLRSSRHSHASKSTQQSNGELPTPSSATSDVVVYPDLSRQVPDEDEEAALLRAKNKERVAKKLDQKPGKFYTIPSLEELKLMPKEKLRNVKNFVVGREYYGKVEYESVDLSSTDLDKILGDIVNLSLPHRIQVYGPDCTVSKPPVGAPGLNQPATLTIENVWPVLNPHLSKRANDANLANMVARLKKGTPVTTFVDYDVDKGIWTFKVKHFSTYGFQRDLPGQEGPYYSVEEDDDDDEDPSAPSDFPLAPALPRERVLHIPGSFEEYRVQYSPPNRQREAAPSFPTVVEPQSPAAVSQRRTSELRQPIANAPLFRTPSHSNKLGATRSILKASRLGGPNLETPSKRVLIAQDWTNTLQMSVSPRKQDRTSLRQSQAHFLNGASSIRKPQFSAPSRDSGPPILTSIDLMKSLFGPSAAPDAKSTAFEWPYAKKQKTNHGLQGDESATRGRGGIKPFWNVDGSLTRVTTKVSPPDGFEMVAPRLQEAGLYLMTLKSVEAVAPHSDGLSAQEEQTTFALVENSPLATTNDTVDFSRYRDIGSLQSRAYERDAWSCASILFDRLQGAEELAKLDVNAVELTRTETLQEFWRQLVAEDVKGALKSAASPEERAFVYLSGGDVESAVKCLHMANNSVLALLVTNIGGDRTFRDHCADQMKTWMERDFVSEFPDAIRAIYALLCGHTCTVEGKVTGGHENRVQAFTYSGRFGLDWRRAFGLRLWYGLLSDESIEKAVERFSDDLKSGAESAVPIPTFSPQNAREDGREDLLWGMLKLFASRRGQPSPDPAFLAPENTGSRSMDDYRLSFQLSQLLRASLLPGPPVPNLDEMADKLAYAYHEQLLLQLDDSAPQDFSFSSPAPALWQLALIPLLHIRDRSARDKSIQSVLSRFAGLLPDETDPLFDRLTKLYKVPAGWVFAAKAEFASAVLKDPARQADWLLKAQMWTEAHQVLRTTVGPRAIVEGNFVHLKELLRRFLEAGAQKVIVDWKNGGAILVDFVQLVELMKKTSSTTTEGGQARVGDHDVPMVGGRVVSGAGGADTVISPTSGPDALEQTRLKRECLVQLANSLSELSQRETVTSWSVLQRAAVFEMSRLVSRAIELDERLSSFGTVVLRFPLEADLRLRYAVELSGRYFERVMGGGEIVA